MTMVKDIVFSDESPAEVWVAYRTWLNKPVRELERFWTPWNDGTRTGFSLHCIYIKFNRRKQ